MKLRSIRWIVVLALFCQQSASLHANGLVREGVGPISTGRGGTNQAFADNAAIILDNPGGMVNVAGKGLVEAGADTVITAVQYSNPFNSIDSQTRPLPTPQLGWICKSDDERWAWGVGAFMPAGFGASYGTLQNPLLGPQRYSSIGGLVKALPGISYKATDRLSVGLTVGLALSDAELNGPLFLQTGPLAGLPTILDIQGIGTAPCGSVGMQYQLFEDTMIGLTYTEQTTMDLRGGANATLLLPNPGPGPPLIPLQSHFDTKIHLKWPRSVAFGIKHELCPHHRVSADVIWYDWAHAFDQLNIQFYNPTNPAVAPILAGAGVGLPVKDSLPLNWTNSISMRLGYEWLPNNRDIWRTGYNYHGSPSPDSTLNPYLDGVLEHAFSVGYSRKMRRVVFNAAYQFNFGKERHVLTSSIIGGDFNNTTLNAQAHFAMFSFLVPF